MYVSVLYYVFFHFLYFVLKDVPVPSDNTHIGNERFRFEVRGTLFRMHGSILSTDQESRPSRYVKRDFNGIHLSAVSRDIPELSHEALDFIGLRRENYVRKKPSFDLPSRPNHHHRPR
jgi:hypothetical protein